MPGRTHLDDGRADGHAEGAWQGEGADGRSLDEERGARHVAANLEPTEVVPDALEGRFERRPMGGDPRIVVGERFDQPTFGLDPSPEGLRGEADLCVERRRAPEAIRFEEQGQRLGVLASPTVLDGTGDELSNLLGLRIVGAGGARDAEDEEADHDPGEGVEEDAICA